MIQLLPVKRNENKEEQCFQCKNYFSRRKFSKMLFNGRHFDFRYFYCKEINRSLGKLFTKQKILLTLNFDISMLCTLTDFKYHQISTIVALNMMVNFMFTLVYAHYTILNTSRKQSLNTHSPAQYSTLLSLCHSGTDTV